MITTRHQRATKTWTRSDKKVTTSGFWDLHGSPGDSTHGGSTVPSRRYTCLVSVLSFNVVPEMLPVQLLLLHHMR